MKKYLFIFSLLLMAFLLSTCFSSWGANEGILSIAWGNTGNSRYFIEQEDLPNLIYEIILTGPGGKIKREYNGVPQAVFSLTPGNWAITVKGQIRKQYTPGGDETSPYELKLMGIEQVEVKAGQNPGKVINMYSAVEADDWWTLYYMATDNVFDYPEPREYIIVLTDSFETMDCTIGNPQTGLYTVNIERQITLVAEKPVTITKPNNHIFFNIFNGGCLTLGKEGMTGTITFEGNNSILGDTNTQIKIERSSPPMINRLIMNKGITIKNSNGEGIATHPGSIFTMNGGTISGNDIGVYLIGTGQSQGKNDGGTFNMNGGTITGNNIGVYVEPDTNFTQKNGTISGNIDNDIAYQPVL